MVFFKWSLCTEEVSVTALLLTGVLVVHTHMALVLTNLCIDIAVGCFTRTMYLEHTGASILKIKTDTRQCHWCNKPNTSHYIWRVFVTVPYPVSLLDDRSESLAQKWLISEQPTPFPNFTVYFYSVKKLEVVKLWSSLSQAFECKNYKNGRRIINGTNNFSAQSTQYYLVQCQTNFC